MIRVHEAEFSAADARSIEKQVKFLEDKVAENHWPKLAIRTCITIVVVSVVFAISRSPLWALLVLLPGAIWAGAVFDSISTQKMQHDWLAYEKSRLDNPRKKEITVEDCDYIDFGEIEDEGVLYLFFDDAGNWLMLEGQNYYPTDKFPSSSFCLSYDSNDALLDIGSDSPFHAPKTRHDPSIKTERELFFGTMDHAVAQAENEDQAISKLKALADGKSK